MRLTQKAFYSLAMFRIYSTTRYIRGARWRSWLRHCATSRKVAGSIPDGVTGIFHWHNPSGCTMALALTQPLTEMSTGKTSLMCRSSWNLGASTSWNPQGLPRPVMGLLYLYANEEVWDPPALIVCESACENLGQRRTTKSENWQTDYVCTVYINTSDAIQGELVFPPAC